MKKLKQIFNSPDNKVWANIANYLLYLAAPIGVFVILIYRAKGKIDADTSTDLLAAWASLIGAFKFVSKFSTPKNERVEKSE